MIDLKINQELNNFSSFNGIDEAFLQIFISKYLKLNNKLFIVLKDDKSLPYILITNRNKWPQILKHRGKQKKNSIYFGPYPSVGIVEKTINSLQKVFLIRSCSDSYFNNRKKPCLLYQIKKCSAPCVNKIDKKNKFDKFYKNYLKYEAKRK